MSRSGWLAMVAAATAGVWVSDLYAADAAAQTVDPCGPLLAHVATLTPDGVVTPDIYSGEGLTGYLQRDDKEPRAILAATTDGCREEVRSGHAEPVSAFVSGALARGPGWVNVGRIVACATQHPAYLSALPEWLADERHAEARAACFGALATWPNAEAIRSSAFRHVVRKDERGWYVDRALLSVIGHPDAWNREVRDALVPVLRVAEERRALGFDTLRAVVCVTNEPLSTERARVCVETNGSAEARWREDQSRTRRWALRFAATIPYAGAVSVAYAGRSSDVGLAVATGAGALAGASLGILLGAWAALSDADEDWVELSMLLGTVALGTLGGFAAHAAVDDAPGWRAPLTAGALLIPLTFVWGSVRE